MILAHVLWHQLVLVLFNPTRILYIQIAKKELMLIELQ